MAIGGIFLGRYIDILPKKFFLSIALFSSAVFFGLECFVFSEVFLYFVSFAYGISYSAYMCIRGPFIMEYAEQEDRPLAFSFLSSFGLSGSAVGTLIGGLLIKYNVFHFADENLSALLFATFVFFISLVPIFFIDYTQHDHKQARDSLEKQEPLKIDSKRGFLQLIPCCNFKIYICVAFIELVLGMLLFFSPYLNLYLKLKFELNIVAISIFLTALRLLPILSNVILAKLFTILKTNRLINTSILICSVSYVGLALFDGIVIQIALITVTTVLSTFVFSVIGGLVLERFEASVYGRISGHLNLWYNVGDSVGTYLEGLLISFLLFELSFALAAALFIVLYILLKWFHHCTIAV